MQPEIAFSAADTAEDVRQYTAVHPLLPIQQRMYSGVLPYC